MNRLIDTRGLSCPAPAVMTIEEIEKGNKNFDILVDNECSKENISRILIKYKYEKEEIQKGEETIFRVKK